MERESSFTLLFARSLSIAHTQTSTTTLSHTRTHYSTGVLVVVVVC